MSNQKYPKRFLNHTRLVSTLNQINRELVHILIHISHNFSRLNMLNNYLNSFHSLLKRNQNISQHHSQFPRKDFDHLVNNQLHKDHTGHYSNRIDSLTNNRDIR
mmetsp:Transcript_15691/g.11093  ORF Transcript_15691/g.11093 Transcript_15691/m.11093 type:complete len:104 (-) Transcript_15691:485-796(-)